MGGIHNCDIPREKGRSSMKLRKYESLWVGVIYFLILLGIALWVRDIPNQPDAFNTTIQQLIKPGVLGMSDPTSFATAAADIAENGWISSANDWIFNLWPPGFVLLEALIIKVLGSAVPVLLVLQVLAVLLFSVVLLLLYELLRRCVKSKVAFALPLLILVFPVSRAFLLQPAGVSLGESFAIGFFLIGVFLAFRSVTHNQIRHAIYAGLCLALSAYFRSQFEIILLALTGWGILLIVAIKYSRLQYSIEPKLVKSVFRTMAVTLLVAHAATIPWRAYHWIHLGYPSWVDTSTVIFVNSVRTSESLVDKEGNFVFEGAGNLVCRIDPATCGDAVHAKKLFIKTFIEHPVEWYSMKLDVIGRYWFSSVKNYSSVYHQSTSMDFVSNGLILVALISSVFLLFTRNVRSHSFWILLVWFIMSLISAYMLIFSLAHFEVRYFYFPKVAAVVMAIIVACLHYRPKTQIDIENF